MTSDGGYPNHDAFGPVVDVYRCTAVDEHRRCQLFIGHTDPHAHAWLGPRTGHVHRSRAYPWHPHVERWTDDGRRWEQAAHERLRWCAMFRP